MKSTEKQTERVVVFDTTLRDGEQAPGFHMTPAEKRRVAEQLARMKVDVIEAGFPVSSPDDFAAVRDIAATVGRGPGAPEICALARCVDADIDAAIAALRPADRGRVHLVIATSDIHAEHKLRMTRDQIRDRVAHSVARAAASGMHVQFSAEDASRSDIGFLTSVVETALANGARTINIPDTVGFAVPDAFGDMIREICATVRKVPGAVVSVHCHDDLGMAVANAIAGVRAGARQVEVAVNGIGERAGNAALEEVVMAIRVRGAEFGIETGVDARGLTAVSRMIAEITGQGVAANKAIVGGNAFAHASGIHQDGILKNKSTYEIFSPEDVGAERTKLVLTARSGRNAIRARLVELGVAVVDGTMEGIYARFKVAADREKSIDDATLIALARP